MTRCGDTLREAVLTMQPAPLVTKPRSDWSEIYRALTAKVEVPVRVDGLTLSHDIGHLWRALLEAYAYAIAHHVEVMNEIGYKTDRFIVSDGGSTSEVWMQIVADVLERPVQRLAGHPGSCVGAAWTAAIGVGLASDWLAISAFVRPAGQIEPRPETADV